MAHHKAFSQSAEGEEEEEEDDTALLQHYVDIGLQRYMPTDPAEAEEFRYKLEMMEDEDR
jgi:hypothetical protein